MKIKKIAKEEKVSINQFISSAAAEKISAIMTVDYLKKEAKRGKRKDFEAIKRRYFPMTKAFSWVNQLLPLKTKISFDF